MIGTFFFELYKSTKTYGVNHNLQFELSNKLAKPSNYSE